MKKGFSRKEYQERIKSIRAFVDFGLDARKTLSPSEKRMVTIYYDAIKKEKFSSSVIYKGAKKDVERVAKIIGSSIPRAKLKAIPVPSKLDNAKAKLKKKKVKVKTESGKIKTVTEYRVEVENVSEANEFVKLDMEQMAFDYETEIIRKLRNKKFKYGQFSFYSGFMSMGFVDIESALVVWEAYLQKYSIEGASGILLWRIKRTPTQQALDREKIKSQLKKDIEKSRKKNQAKAKAKKTIAKRKATGKKAKKK